MTGRQLTILSIAILICLLGIALFVFNYLKTQSAVSNTANKLQAVLAGYNYIPDRAFDSDARYN